MFCSNCGAPVAPDLRFCNQCGTAQPLAGEQPAAPPPAAAFVPPAHIRAQASAWVGAGWQLVKSDLGNFILITLISLVLSAVVPIILKGPLAAGTCIFCMNKLRNRRAEVGDLFLGFNYFVPALIASILIMVFVCAASLLLIIPGLIVAAMYSFTFFFIVDKKMDFWPAMQASHAVVKNDYFGFTIFLLLLVLVNLLGALLCGVGLLFTAPIIPAATAIAYQQLVGFEPDRQS